MTAISITALYASFLAIIFIVLSFRVIKLRRKLLVGIGDGGEKSLAKAIRVHGNFSEYAPFALVMMVLLELSGGNAWLLHACGIALVASRILHAVGITKSVGKSNQRVAGMLLTFGVILVCAIAILALQALNILYS